MTHQLVLAAALIVVTMVILDWLESRRSRIGRAYRQRREQLSASSARHLPEPIPARLHRRGLESSHSTAAKRGTV